MNNSILFSGKNINLFCPWTNEYIFDYIYLLGYSDKELPDWRIKFVVLKVLDILLSYNVINIFQWVGNEGLSTDNLKNAKIIDYIDKIWFVEATYPDFYDMVMIGTPDWYSQKLKELGMTHTTNWEWFVEHKIGDLEKWIEENRPKKESD